MVGKEGEDLSRHDKWLCMIYPRLKLLHRLLSSSGVIFISIDDNELYSLKILMDEIFGVGNFVAQIVVKANPRGRQSQSHLAIVHEYCLVYAKNINDLTINGVAASESYIKEFKNSDGDGKKWRELGLRQRGAESRREDRPDMFFPIYVNPDNGAVSAERRDGYTVEILPLKSDSSEGRWAWGLDKVKASYDILYGRSVKSKNGQSHDIFYKDYLERNGEVRTQKQATILDIKEVNTELGGKLLKSILGRKVFEYPKPIGLIERLISLVDGKDFIVLDSFAGSGTTAHAVLRLNAIDNGNRKFICIEQNSYAEDTTAERVRRVITGYTDSNEAVAGTGGGFDFYTVGAPLFNDDKNLNEEVGEVIIRDYVAYSERIPPYAKCVSTEGSDSNHIAQKVSSHSLGVTDTSLWVFYYDRDRITTLDLDFLGTLNINALHDEGKARPELFIIYADKCALPIDFLYKHSITFKRIPRDITRF